MEYNLNTLASEFIDTSDKIIPVIGDGVMFYLDDQNNRIPLLQYVVERFKTDYPQISIPNENRSDLFILTCYSHEIKPAAFDGAYKRYIKEARNNKKIELDPIVLDFLITFRFPVIVSTCCFSYLEESINKRIVSKKYNSLSYNPKADNSLGLNNTIYHIFGNAEEKFTEWVSNEDVLLDFLHGLHSSDFTCKNLCDLVNNTKSSLLILGCGLPDWLFRFLWYSIGYPEKNQGGYWLNENLNIELYHFLNNISYSPVKTVNDFLILTTELKKTEQNFDQQENKNQIKQYDFFISYAGDDELIAKRLYENLKVQGYNVWYDKRGDSEIKPGDKYVAKFAEGVKLSQRAITIITENYIRGVQDPKRGLCEETRLIKQKAQDYLSENREYNFCIPMLIEGRTFNNRKLETSFVENWAGFVSSIEGGLDDLFKGTNMLVVDELNPQLPFSV